MEKKNNFLYMIVLVLVGALCGYIACDKLGSSSKTNNKDNKTIESNNEKVDNNSLEVGSVGDKKNKIELIIDENVYFTIKDGKVLFHSNDGSEIVDSTIPDKVIQIAVAFSCAGNDGRMIALTDKGEVYYNKQELVSMPSKETYEYNFDFIKVITGEKVYGVSSISPNVPQTCGFTNFFAYVSADDMRVLNVQYDNDSLFAYGSPRKVASVSLGKTYNELYPYEKYYLVFSLGGAMLKIEKNGKMYFDEDSSITNKEMYLTNGDDYLLADKVYFKKTTSEDKQELVVVDKTKKVYLITVLKTDSNIYNYKYTVSDMDKSVKTIKEDNDQSSVTIEYTDGTSEIVSK